MIKIKELKKIFQKDPDITYDNKCSVFEGLKIITKYLPDEGVSFVKDDEIYSIKINDIINKGLTKKDAIELRNLCWSISELGDEEYLTISVN